MNRSVLILVIVVLVAIGGGYWAFENGFIGEPATGDSQPQEDVADAPRLEDLENVIWASGKLEPVEWAGLSASNSGIVSRIHVEEGDWVDAGTVLIDLDTANARADLLIAEAGVVEAQAALEKLLAGATSAELEEAKAALAAAEANVMVAASRMLEAQSAIEASRALVRVSEAEYGVLAAPPSQERQIVAQANIAVAEAAVEQAQAAYNLVRGDPQIGARPESRALYEATAALEAAKAQAALSLVGANRQELAVAQGAIDASSAQLAVTESQTMGIEANIQAAMAQRDSAQAALEKLEAGPTAEDIAIAEARVTSAQATVAAAEARLTQNQILAPFDGQVGSINVRVGEQPDIGQALVQFGDVREMHVRTTDLRETDVIFLKEGMTAEVTFDALPDEIFSGIITRVAPISNSDRGSTNYTVNLDVTNLDDRLRWGMTAFVNIQVER